MMLAVGRIAGLFIWMKVAFAWSSTMGMTPGAVPHLHMHLLAGRKLEWPPG